MGNGDYPAPNLTANFVPCSIPDVGRWAGVVAPSSTRCRTPSDSWIRAAWRVAFR